MAAKAKKEAEFRFELKGRVLEINSEDLEFGEVEWIEDYLGMALARIDFLSIKAQWAVAYIAYKRKKPEVTFDELRKWKLTSLKAGDKVRPTQAKPSESETSGEQD